MEPGPASPRPAPPPTSASRFVRLDRGLVRVTDMFDIDGQETTDWVAAVSAVGQTADGIWLSFDCDPEDFLAPGAIN